MGEGGLGTLSFTVWPSYIGLAAEGQTLLPVEQRAQIQWRPEGDGIVGAARCWTPQGDYSRYLFFHSPDGPSCAHMVMPHPYTQLFDAWVTVDPIVNTDPVVNAVTAIAR